MANYSWLVVCCAALLLGAQAANLVRRDIQRIRDVTADSPTHGAVDPKNASSSMYFQQVFSKEAVGETATKIGQTTPKPSVPLAAHPSSIQAVNKTVNGGNLTSSETQNYYGYEPTGWIHGYVPIMNAHTIDPGINKRHVHYPPVPMDVINSPDDGDSQNEEGDDYDNDDVDDSDDYDGDSGEDRQSSPQQGSDDGEGEERDEIDDFDPSATFAIPKIDPNHAGCKTVYKEVQSGPGKVKSIDDDFDSEFAFKRRRKRSAATADPKRSATSASFVLARECHFSDEGNERKKAPLQPTAPAPPSLSPMPSQLAAPIGTPAAGPIPESAKPKVTTGESRFVPINADPWRAPRGARGIGFGNRANYPMANARPYMSADETARRKNADFGTFNGDGQNTQHFHKYPYPHYHIYYNRPGVSVLDEKSARYGSSDPPPQSEARDDDDGPEQDTFESPNSYFEFTNPNGNGNEQPDYQSENQDEDDDEGNGDNSNGDEDQGDDDGLAAAPEGRSHRARRGTRGRHSGLPLPPTLSPSHSPGGKKKDNIYGWAVSGPNFYKSGKYENGDGKKRPKKYSYNYYQREDPDKSDVEDTLDSDSDSTIKTKSGFSRPKGGRSQRSGSSHSTKINHAPPKNGKRTPLMNDAGDYLINYGSGTFKEYDHEYDSDKDKNRNKNRNQHADNDDSGHEGGQDGEDDGSYEGDNSGQYHDDQGDQGDQGEHGDQNDQGDQGDVGEEFDF